MKKAVALVLVLCLLFTSVSVFASKTAEQEFSTETQKGEKIIPITEMTGSWAESTTVKNYDGGKHVWSSQKGDTLTFKITGISKGNYEVYYWVCPHVNNAEKMELVINHNGKADAASVYQKLNEGEAVEPGWVSLGVYDFAASGDESVTHICPGGNTRGTGVKLVPTTKEVTESKPVEESKTDNSSKNVNLSDEITVEPFDGFSFVGDWETSSTLQNPTKKNPMSMWIAAATEKDYCQYNPKIDAVGDVRISVYLLAWKENQTTDVKYEVYHNGKKDEFHIDMTKLTGNKWETLGTFDFAGKGDEYVRVVGTGAGNKKTNTRASTVAFEIINNVDGGVWQTIYISPSDKEKAEAERKTLEAWQEDQKKMLSAFDDTKDHWAFYDIGYMAHEGLIQGVADRMFDPESTITRAEFVTILDRAMGYEQVSENSYADVAEGDWFYTYVAAAKKNGLLESLPVADGFKPDQPITREEMATIIYNAIKATGKNDEWVAKLPDDYKNFTDTDKVSDYAKKALQYLIQTGIIKGTTETTVSPEETATRAQAAVILKRFMQMFVWAGPPTDEEWVLTFDDEFLGGDVDWNTWVSDNSAPGHIQSSRWKENVEVHDGSVYLMTKKETRGGKVWTTGNIWVNPEVFRQAYGYWEARYKFTAHAGINNSFWGITTSYPSGVITDNKQNFELDICEGHYPNKVNTNYHSWYTGTRLQHSEQYKSDYDLSADYHTYALEWNEDELIYYFDGKVIATKKNENASIPLYPYLSSAVINWAGGITDAADGTAQIVDYVRIYQRKKDVNDETKTFINKPISGSFTPKPSDVEGEWKTVTVADQKVATATYPGEIIIPCTTEGEWKTSTSIPNYNGGEHYWTDKAGLVSKYLLKDVKAGEYDVYFWRLPHKYNVKQMDFTLVQNDKKTAAGSAALYIAYGETAEAGWVKIGTQTLTGDKDAYFLYTCPGGNCRATAIKLVPVKK